MSTPILALWILVGCGSSPEPPAEKPEVEVVQCEAGPAPAGAPVRAVRSWTVETGLRGFPEGSPTLCDLDGDGTEELVAPLAPAPPAMARIAVYSATTGEQRWRSGLIPKNDFGTPICVDADADGDLDVLGSGRSGDVRALDGKTGEELWALSGGDPAFRERGNTYSVVRAPDGRLFTSQGGGGGPSMDGTVKPDVPGRLLQLDGRGKLLATWEAPESREIYSSPAVRRTKEGLRLAIGTGGERLRGALHLVDLPDGSTEFVARASVPSSCAGGGFEASPVFADLDGDGTPEVVAVDYCGTVHAIADDGSVRWSATADIPHSVANPLLADLDEDGALDVVAAFESLNPSLRGDTLKNPRGLVVAYRGADGSPLWEHRVDRWVFASPVSADFDGDGAEDVLVLESASMQPVAPRMVVLSGRDGAVLFEEALGETASTPVFGDVDDDGHLDLFFVEGAPDDGPVSVRRLEFCGRPHDPERSWSGFRGPRHDGVRSE